MIDAVTWQSERLMLMARMFTSIAGLWGEESKDKVVMQG